MRNVIFSSAAQVALTAALAIVAMDPPAAAEPQKDEASAKAIGQSPALSAVKKPSPYRAKSHPQQAGDYYQSLWGIDSLRVNRTASGNLIRFSYRVVDPVRAKAVAARDATPYLIGHTSRAVLHVPVMEKVGPLRQSMTPEAGKEYWMAFANKEKLVKPGERVTIQIGNFRADGLAVQ